MSIRDNWIQTNDTIVITLYAKNLTTNDINCNFINNRVIELEIEKLSYKKKWYLYDEIILDDNLNSIDVTAYKVLIKAHKKNKIEWKSLEALNQDHVHTRENIINSAASIPTFGNEFKDKDESDEEEPTGDAALNKLFQNIYKNADADTKRAMIKSFQTSGGTVLSTNWKEVKEAKYEDNIEAPKGQEVKKW